MPLYKAFQWVQHIQNLTFLHENSIKESYFVCCIIPDVIFKDFGATWWQTARLGKLFGASWCPRRRPISFKWRQKAARAQTMVALLRVPKPTCFQKPFRSAPGHHFDWFRINFDCFFMDLWSTLGPKSCILGHFLGVYFCNCSESLEKSNKIK